MTGAVGPQPDNDSGPGSLGLIDSYKTTPMRLARVADDAHLDDEVEEVDAFSNLLTYWDMVLKHRWLIAGCLTLGLAIGGAINLLTTPVYRATATIQIDQEPAKVSALDDQQVAQRVTTEKYYETQYELLKSRTLAERVVQRQGLADDPAFMSQWMGSRSRKPAGPLPSDRKAKLNSAIALVNGQLIVEPIKGSQVVRVSYESPDAALASKVANGVAETYIGWNLERRYEASAEARKFLEDRLQQTRQALEDSQRRGNQYAQQNELITLGASAADDQGKGATNGESLAAADLASINASLTQATAARIQAEQKWRQAIQAPDLSIPEVLASPAVLALKTARDQAAAEYSQNLRTFKPDYPDMVQTKAKIEAIDQQIAGQARVIRASLQNQYEVALNNERQLQGEVNRRKSEVLRIQGKRVEQGFIDTDVNTSRALYDSMLATYKQIGIAGAVTENNISFVDRATSPRGPVRPRPARNLLLFGLAGLGLGVLISLLLERLDTSMKVPEDVQRHLDLALLGAIPLAAKDTAIIRALEDPKSQLSEAYYSVRAALRFATEHGAPRTLLVTSSAPAEGKTTTSLAIASGFARLGLRVLLVDSDMRDPSLHKVLARDNGMGLSNLLAGSSDINPALQPTMFDGLTLLPSGPLPPNPAELLGGARMLAFLDAAQANFDMVVIDAPPVMGLADAPQLANLVEGVVMIVEAGRTKRDLAKRAVQRLRANHGKMIGAVMTKFDLKKAGYAYGHAYGYGYGYGYGYDYGSRPEQIARKPAFLGLLRGRTR